MGAWEMFCFVDSGKDGQMLVGCLGIKAKNVPNVLQETWETLTKNVSAIE